MGFDCEFWHVLGFPESCGHLCGQPGAYFALQCMWDILTGW